ncbi:dual specificity protein phosphatase 19 [Thrips palmi]|uniref:Dual specificity protein phosphatase 19 n=1 Tax=Thrips palmi TaxID=161013 RepID=A0A6P8Z5P4_THRPL|nr:dual specificity protein phosphatase 19 [Thrips palmi]
MSFLHELNKKRTLLNHTCTRVTTIQGNTIIEEVVQGKQTSHEVPEKNQMCPGFVVDTKPDLQVAEILPSMLYLGSQDVTQDIELLKKYQITHILSIGVSVAPLPEMSQLCYTFVPALDLPDEKIDFALATALPLIEETISKGGSVFVHCNAGVSRSPMVVIAFLMVHRGFTYSKANALVKEKRPAAKPNAGFVRQLLELECKSQASSSNK